MTVLLLPNGQGRFRKLHLQSWHAVAVAVLLFVTAATGWYLARQVVTSHLRAERVAELELDNAKLRADNGRFESRLDSLSQQLSRFEAQTGRLAEALGVEGADGPPPAAGGPVDGPPIADPLEFELDSLESRRQFLDTSLKELESAFRLRGQRLAATPNVMPADGWFSHGYGWRKDPFTGKRQFHRGVDIVNDYGAKVVAPADGTVSRTMRLADYGRMIDLDHGYGYVTRYGHLSEILVKSGQRVKRGQVIGKIGSTGRSTGPHLHYEVFRDGRRVNPWKYLGRKGR
jgi:murein DD-endopeptidase MepM/ murein hydrolase activator NlpD